MQVGSVYLLLHANKNVTVAKALRRVLGWHGYLPIVNEMQENKEKNLQGKITMAIMRFPLEPPIGWIGYKQAQHKTSVIIQSFSNFVRSIDFGFDYAFLLHKQ